MTNNQLETVYSPSTEIPHLTLHAKSRMNSRKISAIALDLTISYGRVAHVRGAEIFVIGKKEVARYEQAGIDLSILEGIHVVCDSRSGSILTAYRNKDLKGVRQ